MGQLIRVYKLVQFRIYSEALGSNPSTLKLVIVTHTSNLNIQGFEARGSGSSRQFSVKQVSGQPGVHEVLSRRPVREEGRRGKLRIKKGWREERILKKQVRRFGYGIFFLIIPQTNEIAAQDSVGHTLKFLGAACHCLLILRSQSADVHVCAH